MLRIKSNCLLFSLTFVRRNPTCKIKYEFRLFRILFDDRRVRKAYWQAGGFFWTVVCGHFYVQTPNGTEMHFSSNCNHNRFIKSGKINRDRNGLIRRCETIDVPLYPTLDLTGWPI